MLGSLLRAVVVIVLVVAALAFFVGYRFADGRLVGPGEERPVGTAGRTEGGIDPSDAREKGAAAGEAIANASNRAVDALGDASLTAKIKSKMALDDTVKALDINVTTTDARVTLSGYVHSEGERARALALARETDGVKNVTDQLQIRR